MKLRIFFAHPKPGSSQPAGQPSMANPLWAGVVLALCLVAGPVAAQTAVKPGVPVAAPADNRLTPRNASLPAKGLFKGDQLSDAAKARLTDLIVDALGLDVEVALLVPTGPWNIDGGGHTERDLNEARLAALRKFLVDRGIEPKRIFVESRVDAKITEPRLDVQLIGRPSSN